MINIKRVVDDYEHRLENNLDIPPYLHKQYKGIVESETDPKRGLSILIDGLVDERNYMDKLLDREWMDGLSDKEWMEKLEKMHGMKVIDV